MGRRRLIDNIDQLHVKGHLRDMNTKTHSFNELVEKILNNSVLSELFSKIINTNRLPKDIVREFRLKGINTEELKQLISKIYKDLQTHPFHMPKEWKKEAIEIIKYLRQNGKFGRNGELIFKISRERARQKLARIGLNYEKTRRFLKIREDLVSNLIHYEGNISKVSRNMRINIDDILKEFNTRRLSKEDVQKICERFNAIDYE